MCPNFAAPCYATVPPHPLICGGASCLRNFLDLRGTETEVSNKCIVMLYQGIGTNQSMSQREHFCYVTTCSFLGREGEEGERLP